MDLASAADDLTAVVGRTGGTTRLLTDPIPFSSVRRYKVIQLSNGLKVLLVSDKRASRSSASVSINGAGQFADPDDLPGLAHLMEHMILSSNSKGTFRRSRDFEDWLGDHEGGSNGFTAYDKVCFHFSCESGAFSQALERFSSLFVQQNVENVCLSNETLKREIRRVDSELHFDNEATQAYYLIKSFVNLEHPFARFSIGSKKSLEKDPQKRGDDVRVRLIRFFQYHYLPSQAILVAVGPQDLFSLERSVQSFAPTFSTVKLDPNSPRAAKAYPGGFLQGNRFKQMVLYRGQGGSETEKLSFDWPLNLDYNERFVDGKLCATATQIAFILTQILGRRGPGSLYAFLTRRGWVPATSAGLPRILVPLDVSGFQIMKLQLTLTREGFLNRYAIVAAVYDILRSVVNGSALSRPLMAQYATIAKLHGYLLAPRPPDAVELGVDALFYGLQGSFGVETGCWCRFPSEDDRTSLDALRRATVSAISEMCDPENAIILATAGTETLRSSRLFDDPLPPLASPRWLVEPVSGARFCFEDMLRLSSRIEELVLTKLVDTEELQLPVLNTLIPAYLRNARDTGISAVQPNSYERVMFPTVSEQGSSFRRTIAGTGNSNWFVLYPSPYQEGMPLPRCPPEPTCRCAFVLQLLSTRPARANVRQAAQAELWKLSFEDAVFDLAELGAPGGLAFDISFNKFGLRLAFLGISQTLPSYSRRFCRRLVEHPFRLLQGPERLPFKINSAAIASANRATGLGSQRRRRIVSNLRSSSAYEAATENIAFLRSCHGAVCFAEGDLLSNEVESLLIELKGIFENSFASAGKPNVATPTIDDLVYQPSWNPRSAFSCSVPGVVLISDACGRVPR